MQRETIKSQIIGKNRKIVISKLSVSIEELPGMCEIWYEVGFYQILMINLVDYMFISCISNTDVESESESLEIFNSLDASVVV